MEKEMIKSGSILCTVIITFFILITPTIPASSIENPSSHLTLNILNETTAFVDWYIHCSGEYAVYLPLERERLEKNIGDLEKGIEQLLLQDVQNIKITQENETLLITFNLKGDYTNGFVTGKCQYLPELVKYAPIGLNVLKVVIPKDKTLSMVDPGPNGMEGNELTFYDYNWIYPIEISYYAEKDYSGKAVTTVIGKEWQIPQLEVFSVEDIETSVNGANNYSKFAIPDDWVGTGDATPSGTTKTALEIANDYKPRLYLNTDQCSNAVYYCVVNGYDPYAGFDAYLIQYFVYWRCQDCAPACHEYDYEPIFVWVRNIGEKPYRIAYDHWGGILDWHVHEIHRTYLWSSCSDGEYPMPSGVFTQHKAYYPFGRSEYDQDGVDDIYLWNLSSSLQSNWDGNHVKLGIANCYHTFDTDTSGSYCGDYPLSHLDDDHLVTWYRNEIDDDDPCDFCDCDWWESWKVMPFKYDIPDPFYGVFWEDHYNRDSEFPTLSTAIDSALVDNGVLTANVSVFYDNTDAEGSSGNDLRGLWKDRFNATVDGESIGNPYSLNEHEAGCYILEFDVSGISPGTYTLALNVTDNLDYNFSVDYETVIIQNLPPVASFTYTPLNPIVNQTITLNASDSYDPDGGAITKYEWVFDDGNIANTTEAIITHSYSEAGDYIVNLTVEDDEGTRNTTSKTITVHPQAIFDTEAPANPYPSIFGIHNGTIKPNQTITVSKLYTYPCSGTGGHTEYARIWNLTLNVSANWDGYKEDWHNISFNKSFTLVKNKTYNYTIVTGSYPQIIHESPFNATGGTITCDKFIDANGWVYYDWIPAIKLFL